MRYRLQRHDGTDCSATMVPITVLRMVPIQRYRHRHAMKTYKRIMKAQLLAIDNATLFPLKREDIMLLFKLVNEFQEKTSLIVTANYSLTEWLAIPGEEAVAAALLDRLLYCCEIIQLSRNSYRMENRKTIFSNRSEDTDTLKELTTVK